MRQNGKQFWRSLEELSNDEQFLVPLRREFPEYANRLHDGATRRQFLQLMGASLALAGVQGCMEQPQEQIVPFVRSAGKTHSRPAAVLCDRDDARRGGRRPVGREPHGAAGENRRQSAAPRRAGDHGHRRLPTGRVRFGATDAFSQAVVLSLYDPDRSQAVLHNGQIDTWESFLAELQRQLQPLRERGGRGLRVLTGTVVSPTLGHQLSNAAGAVSASAMASVRAGESRQRAAGQPAGVRRGCRDARPCWSKRM